jgi:ABC-2 type transport system permease protein
MDTLRLYFRYIGISLRSQMQYRTSFFMLLTGHLLITGIEFLGMWALFERFSGLRGWTLSEVALMYGMVNIAFSLAEIAGRGFDAFSTLVRGGDFDRLLLRPRSTAFQVAGQEVQLFRIGRGLQGLIVLLYAITGIPEACSFPNLVLIAFSILGGASMFYGILILQATLCFWTVESLEVMNILTNGGTQAAQYPLTIYRPWFRLFFTFVIPLACVNYIPAAYILGRPDAPGISPLLTWAAPCIGLLFFLLALQVWNFGVRRYCSTGH